MKATLILICLCCCVALVLGQASSAVNGVAKVVDATGTVDKQIPPAQRFVKVNVGDLLNPDTSIRTGPNSAVLLVLQDKHTFRIGEGSLVRMKELGGKDKSYSFEVVRGKIWSFVDKAQKPAKYEVDTPSVVLGVSGTLFSAFHNVQTNVTNMSVDDGTVSAKQGDKTVKVSKGYQLRLAKNQATPLAPQKQNAATEAMWKHLKEHESWTKPNPNPHIDPQTEQALRTINANAAANANANAKAKAGGTSKATKKQPDTKDKP